MTKNDILFIFLYCGLMATAVGILVFAVVTNAFGQITITGPEIQPSSSSVMLEDESILFLNITY